MTPKSQSKKYSYLNNNYSVHPNYGGTSENKTDENKEREQPTSGRSATTSDTQVVTLEISNPENLPKNNSNSNKLEYFKNPLKVGLYTVGAASVAYVEGAWATIQSGCEHENLEEVLHHYQGSGMLGLGGITLFVSTLAFAARSLNKNLFSNDFEYSKKSRCFLYSCSLGTVVILYLINLAAPMFGKSILENIKSCHLQECTYETMATNYAKSNGIIYGTLTGGAIVGINVIGLLLKICQNRRTH